MTDLSRSQLVSIPEAAALLAVTPATLRKWRAQGRLPAVKLGRAVRIRLTDVSRIAEVGLKERELHRADR